MVWMVAPATTMGRLWGGAGIWRDWANAEVLATSAATTAMKTSGSS